MANIAYQTASKVTFHDLSIQVKSFDSQFTLFSFFLFFEDTMHRQQHSEGSPLTCERPLDPSLLRSFRASRPAPQRRRTGGLPIPTGTISEK